MKLHLIRVFGTVLACSASLLAEPSVTLDGAAGHIHKVKLSERSFELLKETEYDPKSDIGQSRFTIHWDQETRVVEVSELNDFSGIQGPVTALFHGIRTADRDALSRGQPFEARVVTLFSDPALARDLVTDENQVLGVFTPSNDQLRAGLIEVNGRQVEVALRKKYWKIWSRQLHAPDVLAQGFWKAELEGDERDGRFVASLITLGKLPDPRLTDDPQLPRVLVIGDSISMNYHDAAKAALKGVANYHRCEGNAFSSGHGVRNSELWMGEYQEPGFQWDVIQFNHGLHDLKQAYDKEADSFGAYAVSLEQYRLNLEQMIGILKQSGARLVWCSTTPVPNDNKSTYARRKGAAREFNEAALQVMRKHPEIVVNDLHGFIEQSPVFDDWRKTRDVHFYRDAEKQALGEAVARGIRQALKAPKK